jgi:hypothetical protein
MTYRKALNILRGNKLRSIFAAPSDFFRQYAEAVQIATEVLAKEVEKQEAAEDAEFKEIE